MSSDRLHFYNVDAFPIMSEKSTVRDCLLEMNSKNCGFCAIVENSGKMTGLITDGDFRRVITNINVNFSALMVADASSIMTDQFLFTQSEDLSEIEKLIIDKNINELPKLNEQKKIEGLYRVMGIRK